ncbi:MAG TPA: hypothetical protein VGU20_08270 [Stellaceae bacterium]|nr:hypothetical protein [Stellaceae bacterium]
MAPNTAGRGKFNKGIRAAAVATIGAKLFINLKTAQVLSLEMPTPLNVTPIVHRTMVSADSIVVGL